MGKERNYRVPYPYEDRPVRKRKSSRETQLNQDAFLPVNGMGPNFGRYRPVCDLC